MLEVRRLHKWLGGRAVLDGLDLSWNRPGVLAIVGQNGAGKSTLLRVVCGVLDHDGGEVLLAGASLARERTRALRALGYLPEAPALPAHLTGPELVALVAALKACSPPPPELAARV